MAHMKTSAVTREAQQTLKSIDRQLSLLIEIYSTYRNIRNREVNLFGLTHGRHS